jgi:hypothetical protein
MQHAPTTVYFAILLLLDYNRKGKSRLGLRRFYGLMLGASSDIAGMALRFDRYDERCKNGSYLSFFGSLSQRETWEGLMVSSTTSNNASESFWRSTSSRTLAPKASRVFWASYLLR